MERKEILQNLKKIDEEASIILEGINEKLDVIIVGGGAFLLKRLIDRATPDIDTLNYYDVLVNIMNKYDMNSNVRAYCGSLPYNYQDRLEPLDIKTKVLNYMVLSNEDLALTKIASYREKDISDLKSMVKKDKLDFVKLQKLVNDGEMEKSALNQRDYDQFLFNYTRFIKDFKK